MIKQNGLINRINSDQNQNCNYFNYNCNFKIKLIAIIRTVVIFAVGLLWLDNNFIITSMAELQIIIQEIKALGYLFTSKPQKQQIQPQEADEEIPDRRRFRLSFGNRTYISKQPGLFKSQTQLNFYQPYSFFYDNHSRVLNIEIFRQHEFSKNDDYKYQLNAEIDLSDFSIIKGDFIQAVLTDVYGSSMGRILLVVDVFRKGPRYYEKVVSTVLFEKVKQEVERVEREHKVTAAGKNIRNLIVNNQLSNTLMTINSMHVIPQTEDPQIFNKDCLILTKYGPSIRSFTKPTKSQNKDSTSFMDYLEFSKNQQFKFEFFFLFIDQLGVFNCKARGEIKYIIFDQTINAHSVVLFDRKSTKYGMLMVKFVEREVQGNPNIVYKMDKKIKDSEPAINQAIDAFNRYKFEAKYNNHVLSQKMREIELLRQKEEQQKNRPLNQEEKRKAQEHKKFIEFLQKEVLRIERELQKREEKNKHAERKEKYLPTVVQKKVEKGANLNNSMQVSSSTTEFREGKTKLPKV